MAEYDGSIELISGITQKNGGTFPLVDASAVQVDASGTRLNNWVKTLNASALVLCEKDMWELYSESPIPIYRATIVTPFSPATAYVIKTMCENTNAEIRIHYEYSQEWHDAHPSSEGEVQSIKDTGAGLQNKAFSTKSLADGVESISFIEAIGFEEKDIWTTNIVPYNTTYSVAESGYTIAAGENSHAEGRNTMALSTFAHAEGSGTIAGVSAPSNKGNSAHAEGSDTSATGNFSHSEGQFTTAQGSYTHAEGYGTTAQGAGSHAEGDGTIAEGKASHAEGVHTIANHLAQHVFGRYNLSDTSENPSNAVGTYIEIVGNGSSDGARSNARTLNLTGNEWLAGTLTVGKAPTNNMDVATKQYVDEKIGTDLSAKADKSNTVLDTTLSRGRKNDTEVGLGSFAFGNNVTASGAYSHAEGGFTVASNSTSHAEGYNTKATGEHSHSEGRGTTASGDYTSHAEGHSTEASGGWGSHAEGHGTIANHKAQHVFGEYNIADTSTTESTERGTFVEIVGNGESPNIRSNARTLDWDGNETIAGTLTVGRAPENNMEVATKQYVDNAMGANDAMVFRGTIGSSGATVSSLPATHKAGWAYKVATANEYAGVNCEVGDLIICVVDGTSANDADWTVIQNNIEPDVYALKNNPEFTGSISMGRNSSSAVGTNSVAAGYGPEATGYYSVAVGSRAKATAECANAEGTNTHAAGLSSHAEGRGEANTTYLGDNKTYIGTGAHGAFSHSEGSYTWAIGENSHAEGVSTLATGDHAHAEGSGSQASGYSSHAEGNDTIASGSYSHSEGSRTIANHKDQHVFGEYNIADTFGSEPEFRGRYVEIVGNGTASNDRSNARTLDWAGNEVLAGKLTLGVHPEQNMDAVTKQYADETFCPNDAFLRLFQTGTASGKQIIISDGIGNVPLKQFSIDISPNQDLHGYTKPWIGGTGKNLLNINTVIKGKYIKQDGTIVTYDPNTRYSQLIPVTEGQVYTASWIYGYSDSWTMRIHGYNSSGAWRSEIANKLNTAVSTSVDSLTFTVPSGITQVRMSFRSEYSNVQLEKGSSATAWEPYENICPIQSWNSVPLLQTGKNLIAITATSGTVSNVVVTVNNDGTVKLNGTANADGTITLASGISTKGSEVYTLTGCPSEGVYNSTYWLNYFGDGIDEDGNDVFLSTYTTGGISGGISSEYDLTGTVSIKFKNGTVFNNVVFSPMLSNQNLTRDFEPGVKRTYSIAIPSEAGTVYGCQIVLDENGEGELVVNSAYAVIDKSDNIIRNGDRVFTIPETALPGILHQFTAEGLYCDKLLCATGNIQDNRAYVDDTTTGLRVRTSGYYATSALMLESFGGSIGFVYPLATPVTYHLSATQVKTLLGMNIISSDAGIMNIEYYKSMDAGYATKKSSVFTDSISMGRDRTSTVGKNSSAFGDTVTASGSSSHAEGERTSASGYDSHAEGYLSDARGGSAHAEGRHTKAFGSNSHSEGDSTSASGAESHAEGLGTTASGDNSHAEGYLTEASGDTSHAEGEYTVASRACQHVFGSCNIVDTFGDTVNAKGKYVEIVGNGTGTDARSNARTLDWNGNERLAGTLTVGINPTNNMDVATKQYVDTIIANEGAIIVDFGTLTADTYTEAEFTSSSLDIDSSYKAISVELGDASAVSSPILVKTGNDSVYVTATLTKSTTMKVVLIKCAKTVVVEQTEMAPEEEEIIPG